MSIWTERDHIKFKSIDHIFDYYYFIFGTISPYKEHLKLTMGDIELYWSISPSVQNSKLFPTFVGKIEHFLHFYIIQRQKINYSFQVFFFFFIYWTELNRINIKENNLTYKQKQGRCNGKHRAI